LGDGRLPPNFRIMDFAVFVHCNAPNDGYDRIWPSSACLRLAAFGGASAGVTLRAVTGGF
jgi:hypothetical protein